MLRILPTVALLFVAGGTATDDSHADVHDTSLTDAGPASSHSVVGQTLPDVGAPTQALLPACVKKIAVEYNAEIIDDKYRHCLAVGEIYRQCGAMQAWLATIGKEFQDVFGPGSADFEDLSASIDGIACATGGGASGSPRLARCCQRHGWWP